MKVKFPMIFRRITHTRHPPEIFAFAVREGHRVRVLAAEIEQDYSGVGRRLVDVSEAWVDIEEVTRIIHLAKEALENSDL
jgi:hypothetical protein